VEPKARSAKDTLKVGGASGKIAGNKELNLESSSAIHARMELPGLEIYFEDRCYCIIV
jgi:hypothetical protein